MKFNVESTGSRAHAYRVSLSSPHWATLLILRNSWSGEIRHTLGLMVGWCLLSEEGHRVAKPQGPPPECSIVSDSSTWIRQVMRERTREALEKFLDHRVTMRRLCSKIMQNFKINSLANKCVWMLPVSGARDTVVSKTGGGPAFYSLNACDYCVLFSWLHLSLANNQPAFIKCPLWGRKWDHNRCCETPPPSLDRNK